MNGKRRPEAERRCQRRLNVARQSMLHNFEIFLMDFGKINERRYPEAHPHDGL